MRMHAPYKEGHLYSLLASSRKSPNRERSTLSSRSCGCSCTAAILQLAVIRYNDIYRGAETLSSSRESSKKHEKKNKILDCMKRRKKQRKKRNKKQINGKFEQTRALQGILPFSHFHSHSFRLLVAEFVCFSFVRSFFSHPSPKG